eukprot:scaffold12600_cov107-Isochrysis_galbana.AAC.1
MSISSYASDHSAASQPPSHSQDFIHSINPVPSVGHGSARHSRDVRDRRPCTPPVRLSSRGGKKEGVWEYKLYGGALLAPHCLYVFAIDLMPPPKGVWGKGCGKATELYVDNTGAEAEMLAKERKVTSRSRHITRRYLKQSAGVRG